MSWSLLIVRVLFEISTWQLVCIFSRLHLTIYWIHISLKSGQRIHNLGTANQQSIHWPWHTGILGWLLLLYPTNNEVVGGYIGFTPSVCPSVRPSVRSVCLSRLPCPLCNIYSSGWILSILITNDHYHERVCRTQWPLTLTYIFKVIGPLLRKLCPLCSVYSSGWILFIFGTNDHYH